MTDELQRVAATIERHLTEIVPLFVKGAKLTFIARIPGNPDADMLLTIDELSEVKKLIERRSAGNV